jgi:hypothetical protein
MAARYHLAAATDPHAPVLTTGEHQLLDERDFAHLHDTFPSDLLVRAGRDEAVESDKSYTVHARTLHDDGSWRTDPARLSAAWTWLVTELVSAPYQSTLLAALGVDPARVGRVEVRLAEYRAGGWMSRHTDRPDKVYSHLIYLCPGWRPDWGGDLTFYADEHTAVASTSLLPGAGTSVAFARTESSWHEVMPVAAHAERPRRTLLLHGYVA